MLKRLQTYDKTARRGRSGDAGRRGSKTEIRGASNSLWFSYIMLIKIGGVQGRSQGGATRAVFGTGRPERSDRGRPDDDEDDQDDDVVRDDR